MQPLKLWIVYKNVNQFVNQKNEQNETITIRHMPIIYMFINRPK